MAGQVRESRLQGKPGIVARAVIRQSRAMSSGLLALLDDVATIAKLAAASIDDVGLAAGKAGVKSAGVVIDDTAVTPRYVVGLSPDRELPIIAKIAVGSIRNKILVLLPGALLLTAFAPFLITPLLMIGGAYLAFEATEKIVEKLLHDHEHEEELVDAMVDPAELEKLQVKGAIRTDFILSAEIMAIALASLGPMSLAMTAAALVAVAVAITVGVYGAVALIVKLDDIGLHLAERENGAARLFGEGLVHFVPKMLVALSGIGTAAMLWVGGGIMLHGLEVMHIAEAVPHALHEWSLDVGEGVGAVGPVVTWLLYAIGASIAGLIVGGIIVVIVRRFHKHPEELIVD
jgi:predicted DNA repair protein MutK